MSGLILPAGLRAPAPRAPSGRSCLMCRYHADEAGDVVCRRYPPQVTVVLVPQPAPRAGQLAPQPFATFPPVVPENVCGEFEEAGA